MVLVVAFGDLPDLPGEDRDRADQHPVQRVLISATTASTTTTAAIISSTHQHVAGRLGVVGDLVAQHGRTVLQLGDRGADLVEGPPPWAASTACPASVPWSRVAAIDRLGDLGRHRAASSSTRSRCARIPGWSVSRAFIFAARLGLGRCTARRTAPGRLPGRSPRNRVRRSAGRPARRAFLAVGAQRTGLVEQDVDLRAVLGGHRRHRPRRSAPAPSDDDADRDDPAAAGSSYWASAHRPPPRLTRSIATSSASGPPLICSARPTSQAGSSGSGTDAVGRLGEQPGQARHVEAFVAVAHPSLDEAVGVHQQGPVVGVELQVVGDRAAGPYAEQQPARGRRPAVDPAAGEQQRRRVPGQPYRGAVVGQVQPDGGDAWRRSPGAGARSSAPAPAPAAPRRRAPRPAPAPATPPAARRRARPRRPRARRRRRRSGRCGRAGSAPRRRSPRRSARRAGRAGRRCAPRPRRSSISGWGSRPRSRRADSAWRSSTSRSRRAFSSARLRSTA